MPTRDAETFSIQHSIDNGIERITYTPKQRRFQTPILMQHGMWHGAWCWQHWQALLAEAGWESHSISLPGHAGSPTQRPVRWCTLGYYLRFLKAEVERLPRPPVLMGHSLGGALVQWYFKYVSDQLPAAVLVAPWVSHSALATSTGKFLRLDPVGVLLAGLTASATPYIRTPQIAARKLISAGALYSPTELHAKLGPESALIMIQHNPPFWFPAKHVRTPLLWLAGELDTLIGVEAERRSAAHYDAKFVVVPRAAHNLMMEHNYRETAALIQRWLEEQRIE